MNKIKEKTINFLDLNNSTLKKIHDFNVYNVDKIIINYKNFSEKAITKKILSLINTLNVLMNLLYNTENDIFTKYHAKTEDEKFWINVDYDANNEVESVTCNEDEIINIISLLDDCISNEENMIYDYITNKLDEVFLFRKKIGQGKAYFNYDVEIIENEI